MLRRIQILVIISIAMLAGCNSVKEEFTKLSQGDVVDVDDGKCLILTAGVNTSGWRVQEKR